MAFDANHSAASHYGRIFAEEEDGRDGNDTHAPRSGSAIGGNRDEAVTTTRDRGCLDDEIALNPVFEYASFFLVIITLFQVITTYRNVEGPFDWFAGAFIPHFLRWGFEAGLGGDVDVGTDGGRMCPPDQWVDEAFVDPHRVEPLYSAAHDPRNRVSQPSLFPRCALGRWVRADEESPCAPGTERVTAIHPPATVGGWGKGGKIPRIIHVSSPDGCLPAPHAEALRSLVSQRPSQAYTVYVHSLAAMDEMLFSRDWGVFPQVKEGALCGTEKLNVAALSAIRELKVGNGTDAAHRIARRVSIGVWRDLWRHMVLWEYGGVVIDAEVLRAILSDADGRASNATSSSAAAGIVVDPGRDALGKLMRQWSAEKEGNAVIYFINNEARQHLPYNERIPLTEIMATAPNHPLTYYSAMIALRYAVWDGEKSITDVGRTTKIPPIREGLQKLDRRWRNVKTGEVMTMDNEGGSSIRFADGDVVLPPSLTSPRTAPWRSTLAAFNSAVAPEDLPPQEKIKTMLRHFAAEQKYIGISAPFSCMEHTMDMFLHRTTEKAESSGAS